MDEWVWVKNDSVNGIPGRIPAQVLDAWEARGWERCPEPQDEAPAEPPKLPDAEASAPKPSQRGQSKEN